jgi:16S rRNA (uracil1498-N3)-methyltransferase
MNLPFFYKENISSSDKHFIFDEETSKHIVQVLRMQPGDLLQVTDGTGNLVTAEIILAHKKKCEVKINYSEFQIRPPRKISIAISLLKNTSRFEWFLEKVTELGIPEIIPLICERTEKTHARYERLKSICISAMLQSKQAWLPDLHKPISFISLIENLNYEEKFIAHCLEIQKENFQDLITNLGHSKIILIGPEGDFTKEEINTAIKNHCIPVSLGETRLRTETAGIVAAIILLHSKPTTPTTHPV